MTTRSALDRRARAELLECGRRRRDDLLGPQRGDEALGKGARVGDLERGRVQPPDHLGAGGSNERTVSEFGLQGGGVLIPGVLPEPVAFDAAPSFADLPGDRAQHRLRDQLAGLEQAARIAQGAELQRKAEPVLRFATPPDPRQILGAQRIVQRASVLVRRQREESPPLARGENAPVRHGCTSRFARLCFCDGIGDGNRT